jgi:hypothetical protein
LKEVETIKDEFTYFNEYNKTTEYQKFPAESYLKPNEENSLGLECSNLGKEVTTIQASPSKKEDKSRRKGLLDKIFNYLKNCATITAVATIAVVGATTITPNPNVELNQFLIDSTYIEYELSVEDLSAQNDYSIVISTTNQDDIEFSISENGIYKNEAFGVTFSAGENWYFLTDSEIAVSMGVAAEEIYGEGTEIVGDHIYDVYCVENTTGGTVSINYEDLGTIGGMTDANYYLETVMTTLLSSGAKDGVVDSSITNIKIGEYEVPCLDIVLEYAGTTIYQKVIVKQSGSWMATATLASLSEDEINSLVEMLSFE